MKKNDNLQGRRPGLGVVHDAVQRVPVHVVGVEAGQRVLAPQGDPRRRRRLPDLRRNGQAGCRQLADWPSSPGLVERQSYCLDCCY